MEAYEDEGILEPSGNGLDWSRTQEQILTCANGHLVVAILGS